MCARSRRRALRVVTPWSQELPLRRLLFRRRTRCRFQFAAPFCEAQRARSGDLSLLRPRTHRLMGRRAGSALREAGDSRTWLLSREPDSPPRSSTLRSGCGSHVKRRPRSPSPSAAAPHSLLGQRTSGSIYKTGPRWSRALGERARRRMVQLAKARGTYDHPYIAEEVGPVAPARKQ